MPTEDNDVLKKNQHDESDSNELDNLELDNYRQNTNLSPKKQHFANIDEPALYPQRLEQNNKRENSFRDINNTADRVNNSKKYNNEIYYSCINISKSNDDTLDMYNCG